ncbi:alpha/beta fold hydrolase [Nocardioides cavernaquae]|uniref:Alpha/beta fold hydrolase n=1 Tax=Nocardioides cavernaquae TaxID=2321396 RepID=A0A3A5H358_9ACTN|nr:alpha/beta fold hydrolase [Nocardioides cavernaquae]RJS45216.1 alpha/beta fold hydrolase [Nocardioides cavernaquae]
MNISDDVSQYVATSDGLSLAVYEDGPADAPVIVFVHGYPDNHHVWDGIAGQLAQDFRVVRYDVRGAGRSDVPVDRSGYRIEQLVDDLGRVINAASPDASVHLVAHDWGSIQSWDALPDDRFGVLIRSFTSISGPSLDHAAVWMRGLRHGLGNRLLQLAESYYIGFFMTPRLPELLARRGFVARMAGLSALVSRPSILPQTATFERGHAETVNGIDLYRANVPQRLLRPHPPQVTLPVQVVVPSRDIHVSAPLAEQAPAPFVSNLTISNIHGNHWVVAQRPVMVAHLIRRFVSSTEAFEPTGIQGKDTAR